MHFPPLLLCVFLVYHLPLCPSPLLCPSFKASRFSVMLSLIYLSLTGLRFPWPPWPSGRNPSLPRLAQGAFLPTIAASPPVTSSHPSLTLRLHLWQRLKRLRFPAFVSLLWLCCWCCQDALPLQLHLVPLANSCSLFMAPLSHHLLQNCPWRNSACISCSSCCSRNTPCFPLLYLLSDVLYTFRMSVFLTGL